MSEVKTDEEQRREAVTQVQHGDKVKALINNPILQDILSKMKAAHFVEFEKASFTDDDKRRELAQRMKVINLFEKQLNDGIKQAEKGKTTLSLLDKAKQLLG